MAHFAEIDENNVVVRVIVIPDEEEHRGQDFCAVDLGLGGTWLKTSYNTFGGQHRTGGTPYRLNFAVPGGIYVPELDGFIEPKPYPSWILDETTGLWIAPIPKPADEEDATFVWDESIVNWKPIPL